jgi:hypothetical protein
MQLATKIRIASLSVAAAIVVSMIGLYQHDSKVEAATAAATEAAQQKADAAANAQAEQEAHARLDRMSPDQLKLENIWVDGVSPYSIAWKSSTNTIKMDQAYADATEATRKLLSGSGNSDMTGWYGKIYAIASYGDHVDLIVESPQGVDYEQSNIPKGSPLYTQLTDMQNGEWVTFSGRITPSATREDDNGSDFATSQFNVTLDDIEQSRN